MRRLRSTPAICLRQFAVAMLAVVWGMAAGATGCSGQGDGDANEVGTGQSTAPERWQPAGDATWQWQLSVPEGSSLNDEVEADIYDVDLFETPETTIDTLHDEGRHVVCYFSAGSSELGRDDFGRFAEAEQGNELDGWPDERWLDLGSHNVRSVMADRLEVAVEKGCDGVEPDNTDGYDSAAGGGNETGVDLTEADTLAYLRWLADEAHGRGLAVGLKNTLGLVDELAGTFDFAVNEECHSFGECGALQPFIDVGKPVLNAEYVEDDTFMAAMAGRIETCEQAAAAGTTTLILPLDLDDSFRVAC